MNETVIEWSKTLTRAEQAQVKIIDGYFRSRYNLPGTSELGEALSEEDKSTVEIIDDLSDMAPIDDYIVSAYMSLCGYGLTTMPDGNVKWAIWRDFRFHG